MTGNKTNTASTLPEKASAFVNRLREHNPAFCDRPGQNLLIQEVLQTLVGESETRILVAEGGTGTGKSAAYLIGGLLAGRHTGKRMVVSTATIALQEQLVNKDLPEIVAQAEGEVRFGIAKGRGRYICPARLGQCLNGSSSLLHDSLTITATQATLASLANELGNDWDGDRDTCRVPVEDGVWKSLTADRFSCSGKSCEWLQSCPYYTARNNLREVDIIVANHDVLMSDLSIGGGVLLPKPEDTIYVIDEGHHLPEKAVRRFSHAVRLQSMERQLESLPRVLKDVRRRVRDTDVTILTQSSERSASELHTAVGTLTSDLGNYGPIMLSSEQDATDLPLWRFPGGKIPPAFVPHADRISQITDSLLQQIRALRERITNLRNTQAIKDTVAEEILVALGVHAGRLYRQQALWALMQEPHDPLSPVARWVSTDEVHETLDYCVEASRINPGQVLADCLWGKAAGVVVTSATLTVGGEFTHFLDRMGLAGRTDVKTLRLQSPFDYSRGKLDVPDMRTNPGNADEHCTEVAEYLPRILDKNEASLVLFASRRQMRAVLEQLPEALRKRALVQGDRPRAELLAEHGRRVKERQGSVLVGLASFAEGLDLPGDLCRHVVITKIPFPMPDGPVDLAIAEWVVARGGNPFIDLVVPAACLRLVQAAGRLLRRETDHGRITILDRRIIDKGYGKILLRSLPPFSMCEALAKRAA